MGFSKGFVAILSKFSSPTWQQNHHDTIAVILEGIFLVSAMIGCILNQCYSQHKTAIPLHDTNKVFCVHITVDI